MIRYVVKYGKTLTGRKKIRSVMMVTGNFYPGQDAKIVVSPYHFRDPVALEVDGKVIIRERVPGFFARIRNRVRKWFSVFWKRFQLTFK